MKGSDFSYSIREIEEGVILTFHVYEDHAELVELAASENTGEPIDIWEVPSKYSGLPVTEAP